MQRNTNVEGYMLSWKRTGCYGGKQGEGTLSSEKAFLIKVIILIHFKKHAMEGISCRRILCQVLE
jgi:hypothetical protein